MDFFERLNGTHAGIYGSTCAALDKFTTLRVGGPADYFAEPKSEEELKQLLAEISFIALREGISPPVLYLITIMNFKEI